MTVLAALPVSALADQVPTKETAMACKYDNGTPKDGAPVISALRVESNNESAHSANDTSVDHNS